LFTSYLKKGQMTSGVFRVAMLSLKLP